MRQFDLYCLDAGIIGRNQAVPAPFGYEGHEKPSLFPVILEVPLATQQHPAASHHLPWFLTAPGETDVLFTFTTIVVVATVLGLGVLFFRLHSLPERLGHKKLQFEIVAVLGLLSLFTHIHAFWVAGLLLALIDLPDFQTPLKRIAAAMEKRNGDGEAVGREPEADPEAKPGARPDAWPEPRRAANATPARLAGGA